MAKAYRCRPSELLGLANVDSHTAFCADRAVWLFGTCVEYDMDQAEQACGKDASQFARDQARQHVFDAYMGTEKTTTPTGRFADPVAQIQAPGR